MSKEAKHIIHPDVAYLLDPKITDVIGQGLAVLYNEKPCDPVDFLAKWLLKTSYSETQRLAVILNDLKKINRTSKRKRRPATCAKSTNKL